MEDKDFLIILDEIIDKSENKYQAIVKIANEIKEHFDLIGERDDTLIIKTLKKLKNKKDEKDSSGHNR